MKIMSNYANPANFLRLARVLIPFSAMLTALSLCVGLYLAWFVAPPDYQHGETVRIMYFSVDWWNTLHQPPSVFRLGGPAIAPSMLWPLVVMAFAFSFLFITLYLMAIRNEILRRRVRRLSILAAGAREQGHAGASSP